MENDILGRDIRYLKGVGEQRARLFNKSGVGSVGALLNYYPRGYVDLRSPCSVEDAPLDTVCAVKAVVTGKTPMTRVRGGKTLSRVYAADDTGSLTVTYFNNRYTPSALAVGREYVFYGKVTGNLIEKAMTNPATPKAADIGSLVPRYPLTKGLTSAAVARAVKTALAECGELPEMLPPQIIREFSLPSRDEAVRGIHFPRDFEHAAKCRRRLVFEDLLVLKLGMTLLRKGDRGSTDVRIGSDGLDDFVSSLPFELTGAQLRSVHETARDLGGPSPMSRLLQGDVGSGKTVVAAAAVYLVHKSGYQSAVMAPTEVLAEQHFKTFSSLLAPFGVRTCLLTSSVKGAARREALQKIAEGEIDLAVGTHAVISDGVEFKSLGFAVVDEQHRFGVRQRSGLARKGASPHMLVMSATPIPRTLALIIYGDLDISVIDEMPKGRRPVRTLLVSSRMRERYLGFVRKTVAEGHAAYIVCPLVDESDELPGIKSATEYLGELEENYLSGLRLGLVHGRMKPAEKSRVMDAFRAGEIDVLVSTTVIEVGVDVPRATLMIIENAERFGLSTLHQLRGRVGRGSDESYCVLVSSSRSEASVERLRVMVETTDGFEIAKKDLKTRGPGDFFGSRQSGLPALHAAQLASDERELYDAVDAAQRIAESDPCLTAPENRALREAAELMLKESSGTLN